jgi:hypothetical protein
MRTWYKQGNISTRTRIAKRSPATTNENHQAREHTKERRNNKDRYVRHSEGSSKGK